MEILIYEKMVVMAAEYVCRPAGFASSTAALPGIPKEPKIMALYPKMESMGSTGSIILAILEVQVDGKLRLASVRARGTQALEAYPPGPQV